MSAPTPADLTCPGCFKRVGGHRQACPVCGAAVWADGRLALVAPIEEGRPGLFHGLLRGDGGALEDVAVKVLDVGGLPNWHDYDRFRRQNDILSRLSHPRIPGARGQLEVGTRVLQCQTLISGRSLARHLRGARLTPAEVTRLAIELLEILEELHGRDVVHRDIKPDNVVIAGEGDRRVRSDVRRLMPARAYLHCNVNGMRWQVAAEQQAPIAHAWMPVQSVEQLLPLQRTLPLHEPVPRQVMLFIAPSACTPIAHDCGPEHVAWHEAPEHPTTP